jgi:hypothetical protein
VLGAVPLTTEGRLSETGDKPGCVNVPEGVQTVEPELPQYCAFAPANNIVAEKSVKITFFMCYDLFLVFQCYKNKISRLVAANFINIFFFTAEGFTEQLYAC